MGGGESKAAVDQCEFGVISLSTQRVHDLASTIVVSLPGFLSRSFATPVSW